MLLHFSMKVSTNLCLHIPMYIPTVIYVLVGVSCEWEVCGDWGGGDMSCEVIGLLTVLSWRFLTTQCKLTGDPNWVVTLRGLTAAKIRGKFGVLVTGGSGERW